MFPLPSRISRYEIKTLIGAGGMGSLYLARDTNPNTNRLVALKLLNATLDSTDLRERFARESRALAALNHPNIVDIYDSGEFQGSPFIVMEYVRGETLAEKIKRKAPLSLGQKLKLMVELCSGLGHAHEAGIIHRDIKPANLMVDQHGRLKILDFGIARMSEGSMTRAGLQMTQLNVRIGTPGYMSPEQIEGGDIDRRSDVFAVGAVVYELLSYREAFTGVNTRQIENKVLEARPAPLISLVPNLDPAIEDIVYKALAKDPHERYQDARALEEALERQRWRLGMEEAVTPAPRATPAPVRNSGARTRDSRADAAYHRSLAVYEEGAVEAARRFAIEALAEDPDHQEARAFIERLGANLWPPPPPPSAMRTTSAPTVLATGTHPAGSGEGAAPTVLSTGTHSSGTGTAAAAGWSRHGKSLQIAAIVLSVAAVVLLAVFLAVSLWPSGPLLTVARPTGGTVWTSGITCGSDAADCTANIAEGETVQLRAEPDEGYVFGGFSGDCTSNGRVHMSGPKSCVATFNPLPKEAAKVTYALTVVKPANGMIVGPGGIRCGSLDTACTAQYPDGMEVTLSAYADLNFVFRGFSGDCSAKGETLMKGARTCSALFVPDQRAAKVPAAPPPVRDRSSRGSSARPGGGGGGGSSADPPVYVPPAPPAGSGLGPSTVDPMRPEPPVPTDPDEPRRPSPPPLSAEALAKKDILKVLEEYRDAYERLDLAGIKRVYPDAPIANLKRGFADYRGLKFALEGEPEFTQVDPSRGIAVVKAKFLLTPEVKVGTQSPYKREEVFNFEMQNGIWIIRSWKGNVVR
jgi:hypothetical protein